MLTESCSMPPGVCHVLWESDSALAFSSFDTVTWPPPSTQGRRAFDCPPSIQQMADAEARVGLAYWNLTQEAAGDTKNNAATVAEFMASLAALRVLRKEEEEKP